MFFFLSKILDYALLPMLWIGVVFLYALFTKNQKRKKKGLIVGLVLLFFFGNGYLISQATYLWQKNGVPISTLPVYQTAILLSGIVVYDENEDADRVNTSGGADRILHTIQLYKIGKVKTILISGGSGTLVGDKSSEAIKLKKILLLSGVNEKDILLEPTSRNTHESSVLAKNMIDSLNIKGKFLLVTSAMRMRRAQGCFTKAGIKTDIFPVEYSGAPIFYFEQFIPSEYAISGWTLLIREITGYVTYKVMGYC
jgi:uncharacterized SAM-binding protein YcdF (DUF218 family)